MINETVLAAIVVPIAVFICVCYNKWLKKRGSKKLRFIQKAKKAGCYTEGVIESTKFYGGLRDSERRDIRSDSLVVKYKYVVNGIPYYKKIEFQSPGCLTIKHPDKVVVYYDPNNPKRAVCPEEANITDEKQSRLVKVFVLFFVILSILGNGLEFLL